VQLRIVQPRDHPPAARIHQPGPVTGQPHHLGLAADRQELLSPHGKRLQQRLVTLALELRTVNDAGSPERAALLAAMSHANDERISILDELREISRGVHPAILSQSGLGAALRSLARRASVPTALDIRGIGRLAQPVEAAAHYVVSEALTNAVKYANATVIHLDVGVNDTTLRLSIDDDSVGADPALGSGIIGLIDRVDAMGGKLTLRSPLGEATSLVIELPLEPAGELDGCRCAHLHLCRWMGISTREVLD
jgi:signal transduction histidine kinase